MKQIRIGGSTRVLSPVNGTASIQKLARTLKPDIAIPLSELREKYGIGMRQIERAVSDIKARVRLVVDGKIVTCMVNPKTAERYNASES